MGFAWLAGVCPVAKLELDYGLLESTGEEILAAYGWSQFNISWLWYLLPSLLLVRPFHEAGANSAAAIILMRAGLFLYGVYRRQRDS